MNFFNRKKDLHHTVVIDVNSGKDTEIDSLLPEWYQSYQELKELDTEIPQLSSTPIMISLEMRESLKEYVKEVMPEPSSSFKIYQKLCRSDIEPSEIAQLVASDPLLAAKVLKTVNSPAYGFSTEITSFGRAVTLMGFRSIKTMVLAQSVKESVTSSKENQAFSESIRNHSAMVSAIAQHVCKTTDSVDESDAATLGLLHDIGKLLYPEILQHGKEINPKGSIPQLVLESIIASVFAELWELPNSLIAAFECLPYPLYYTRDRLHEEQIALVTIIQASNYIANAIGISDGTEEQRPLGHEYLEAVSLDSNPGKWITKTMVSGIEKCRSSLL